MLSLTMKESFTIPEFLQMTRTKAELRNIGAEEYIAKKILNNRRLTAMFTFVAGSLMYCQKVAASVIDSNAALAPIDKGGMTILLLVRKVGYWIALIMCIIEIIKALMNNQQKDIGRVIAKYLLGYGAFYLVPWLFDIIADIFAK